jgi:hypothetical protein
VVFYLLGLLGGVVLVLLDSIYFLFAIPKIEKGWNRKGYLALGAAIWFSAILFLFFIPYVDYCVQVIFQDESVFYRFQQFLIPFWGVAQIYWVIKFYRKQKDYQKNNPIERPIKRSWF